MNIHALFGISALLSLLSSVVFAKLCLVPWLRRRSQTDALVYLVSPHMFRFIGLSFLAQGVVSPLLPAAFALPAAYGDLVAGLLAIVTTLALAKGVTWAITSAWIFNVWGQGIFCWRDTKGDVSIWTLGRSEPPFSFPRRSFRPSS